MNAMNEAEAREDDLDYRAELAAMRAICDAITGLPPRSRRRVLRWATDWGEELAAGPRRSAGRPEALSGPGGGDSLARRLLAEAGGAPGGGE